VRAHTGPSVKAETLVARGAAGSLGGHACAGESESSLSQACCSIPAWPPSEDTIGRELRMRESLWFMLLGCTQAARLHRAQPDAGQGGPIIPSRHIILVPSSSSHPIIPSRLIIRSFHHPLRSASLLTRVSYVPPHVVLRRLDLSGPHSQVWPGDKIQFIATWTDDQVGKDRVQRHSHYLSM
jgi:hypothetical protein